MSSNFSSVGPAQAHKYIRTPLVPLTPLGGFSPHLVVSSLLLMQLHTNCTGNRLQSIERWMDRWNQLRDGWMEEKLGRQACMKAGREEGRQAFPPD